MKRTAWLLWKRGKKKKKSAELDIELLTANPTGVGQCTARTAASAYLFFFVPLLQNRGVD